MNGTKTLKIYEKKDGYQFFFVRKELHPWFEGLGVFTLSCSDGTHYEDLEISRTPDGRCFIFANEFFMEHPTLQKDDMVPFEIKDKRLVLDIKQWEVPLEWRDNHDENQKLVSGYSILRLVQNNLGNILPELRKHEGKKALNYIINKDGKRICIGLLLRDKDNSFVIVEADKNENEVSDKIKIVKETLAKNGENVRGIIIKEARKPSTTILNASNIEISYYRLDFSISGKYEDNQEDNCRIIKGADSTMQFEIMPDSEKSLSDYLATRLHLFNEQLQNIKGKRECRIEGHKIDILCQDVCGNYVIIENKKEDTDYKVVGQVLYYIYLVIKNYINDDLENITNEERNKVKAIILVSKNSQNAIIVKSTLKCCRDWNILLRLYTLKIAFEKQH